MAQRAVCVFQSLLLTGALRGTRQGMSSIFPLRDTVTRDEDQEPRLVDLDEETADEVFEALSSGTTREIFLALHREPQTASDLAEKTDTSVQNVQYHLGKLDDAALVEVVDTWYSERGTEMKVYAPQDDSLVLFAGRDKQSTLRSLLDRVAGVFALLVPVSILAGLGARVTTDTEDGDPVDIETGETDPTDTDDVAAEDDPVGAEVEEDSSDDSGLFDAESEAGVVGENETVHVYDGENVSTVENVTVQEGEIAENATVEDRFAENVTVEDGLAADGGEGGANESIILLQGDGVEIVPVETTETATTVAGMDPALAVGVAVLLGGLAVAGGLAAWYGLSGLPGRSTADTG